MNSRSTLLSILVMVLFVASGIAYAAFTSTATANITGQAGTQILVVESISVTGPSYIGVSSFIPSTSVTVNIGPFAPGDTAHVTVFIKNCGTLPATSLTPAFSTNEPSSAIVDGCSSSVTLLSGPSAPISVGGTSSFYSEVTAGSFGNSCEGITFITVTLSATGSVGS